MAFTTRGSLLSAVRRGDEVGWDEFYAMYKPLILLRGGDLRLSQTEKEELVQLVMLDFFKGSRSFVYDKSKGRFRDYLKRIIHNKACDLMRKRQDGTVSLEAVEEYSSMPEENSDDFGRQWDEEWRKHALNAALEDIKGTIKPETYQIFHAVAIEEVPPQEVAELFDTTANNVYAIKFRIMKSLQKFLYEYEKGDI